MVFAPETVGDIFLFFRLFHHISAKFFQILLHGKHTCTSNIFFTICPKKVHKCIICIHYIKILCRDQDSRHASREKTTDNIFFTTDLFLIRYVDQHSVNEFFTLLILKYNAIGPDPDLLAVLLAKTVTAGILSFFLQLLQHILFNSLKIRWINKITDPLMTAFHQFFSLISKHPAKTVIYFYKWEIRLLIISEHNFTPCAETGQTFPLPFIILRHIGSS